MAFSNAEISMARLDWGRECPTPNRKMAEARYKTTGPET